MVAIPTKLELNVLHELAGLSRLSCTEDILKLFKKACEPVRPQV